ncbi:unnamed protein product [Gordionus sp. m RMFG-2023]
MSIEEDDNIDNTDSMIPTSLPSNANINPSNHLPLTQSQSPAPLLNIPPITAVSFSSSSELQPLNHNLQQNPTGSLTPAVDQNLSTSPSMLPVFDNPSSTSGSKPPGYSECPPPDYGTATRLPSYEEAERVKREAVIPPTVQPQLYSVVMEDTIDSGMTTGRERVGDIADARRDPEPSAARYSIFPFSLMSQDWRSTTQDLIGSDTAFLTSFLSLFNLVNIFFPHSLKSILKPCKPARNRVGA